MDGDEVSSARLVSMSDQLGATFVHALKEYGVALGDRERAAVMATVTQLQAMLEVASRVSGVPWDVMCEQTMPVSSVVGAFIVAARTACGDSEFVSWWVSLPDEPSS